MADAVVREDCLVFVELHAQFGHEAGERMSLLEGDFLESQPDEAAAERLPFDADHVGCHLDRSICAIEHQGEVRPAHFDRYDLDDHGGACEREVRKDGVDFPGIPREGAREAGGVSWRNSAARTGVVDAIHTQNFGRFGGECRPFRVPKRGYFTFRRQR